MFENLFPIPKIDPTTCPIVADISVYPLDHSSHGVAAGKSSIMSTIYSKHVENEGNVYFYASFPGFDETMQIGCDGDYDIGGKIVDHIYQPFKDTSTWQLFRLIRVTKDVVKKREIVDKENKIYEFIGKLYLIHHPKNNTITPKVHYFVKKETRNHYRLLQIAFVIPKNILDEMLEFRKLDLERYFMGNPYCQHVLGNNQRDLRDIR